MPLATTHKCSWLDNCSSRTLRRLADTKSRPSKPRKLINAWPGQKAVLQSWYLRDKQLLIAAGLLIGTAYISHIGKRLPGTSAMIQQELVQICTSVHVMFRTVKSDYNSKVRTVRHDVASQTPREG
jgi:hypothetical protein